MNQKIYTSAVCALFLMAGAGVNPDADNPADNIKKVTQEPATGN
jgi:hypothetical protein